MKQYGALDDTFYLWFGANDTSGSGGDGASPAADVRLAGAAADAAPVYSPTPSLLSHVNYPAGAYEIAITASVANGFATGNTYAVFCTLAIDSQNPTGFVGSFDLKPVESNVTQIGDTAQSATDLKDMVDTGYDPANHKIQSDLIYIHGSVLTETAGQLAAAFTKLFDVATPLLVASEVMRGTDSAYTGTPPTAAAIVNEWESQSQADPTGFHVNVKEVNGTGQTANDNGADINSILTDTAEIGVAGAGLTDLGGMSTGMKAEVESETNDALIALNLDHLMKTATGGADMTTEVVDNTVLSRMLANGDTSVFDPSTDGLQLIRDRGDAAWTTGAGGSDRLLMVDTTIATLASQTSFTLTAGSTDDDAYNNCTIVIEDASTATQKAVGLISNYVGGTKTITLKYDPGIFTIATTDKVYILAENALKATLANRQLNVATDGDIAGNVDGSVASVVSKTGFALSSTGANLILKDSTFAFAIADAIWDEILTGAEHNIATSAGLRVRQIGAYAIHDGTAQAGANVSITLAATASAIDGTYNRNLIVLTDNTGVGQTRTIIDYDGSTKIAIVDREWRTNPDATSEYQVVPDDTPLVVDQGIAQAGSTSSTIKLRAYASSTNDTYLCNIVIIVAGTGRGQARLVGAYDGTSKVVTLCGDDWITTPDDTSVYVMIPYGATCTSCVGDDALAQINTEMDNVLDTAIPGSPTAHSINQRIKAIDELTEGSGSGDLAAIKTKTDNLPDGIKKNTAFTAFTFLMVDSTDHVTGKTGLTVAGSYTGDGSAVASLTNTGAITEISNGLYEIDLTAGELNCNNVHLIFTASGADARVIGIHTST